MKLKNIYTYGGKPARRNLTVADLVSSKGRGKLAQTCPNDYEKAAACAEVGIDIINCGDINLPEVRRGAPNIICIADLPMTLYHTHDEILRAAIHAAENGADIVYTPRSLDVVEMLAKEGLAVQGHAGLIPRKSTQVGGLRVVGKTADEAIRVTRELKRLEDAGAQFVEVECVAAEVLEAVNQHTKLVTHSIGAGSGGDVIFMFLEDLAGDTEKSPAHAQAFGDVTSLRKSISLERIRALKVYREAVYNGEYPSEKNTVPMNSGEKERFLNELEKLNIFS